MRPFAMRVNGIMVTRHTITNPEVNLWTPRAHFSTSASIYARQHNTTGTGIDAGHIKRATMLAEIRPLAPSPVLAQYLFHTKNVH